MKRQLRPPDIRMLDYPLALSPKYLQVLKKKMYITCKQLRYVAPRNNYLNKKLHFILKFCHVIILTFSQLQFFQKDFL